MESKEQTGPVAWLIVAAAGVRAAFGVVMAVDAHLKWQRPLPPITLAISKTPPTPSQAGSHFPNRSPPDSSALRNEELIP